MYLSGFPPTTVFFSDRRSLYYGSLNCRFLSTVALSLSLPPVRSVVLFLWPEASSGIECRSYVTHMSRIWQDVIHMAVIHISSVFEF